MFRILIVLGILTMACAQSQPGEDTAQWREKGEETLRPFQSSLQTAMLEGLAEGPETAISVCRDLAPELAAAASGDGIEVGRTSHKLRNPANAPRAWMLPLLNGYRANPADTTAKIVELEDGGIGYVEPIHIKALCLGCHGTELAPSVKGTLAELYPEDQATGFEKGDFRGMFWVEFEAD